MSTDCHCIRAGSDIGLHKFGVKRARASIHVTGAEYDTFDLGREALLSWTPVSPMLTRNELPAVALKLYVSEPEPLIVPLTVRPLPNAPVTPLACAGAVFVQAA